MNSPDLHSQLEEINHAIRAYKESIEDAESTIEYQTLLIEDFKRELKQGRTEKRRIEKKLV